MTRDRRTPRHQQLARIHIAQRELGIEDATYRDLVERVAGVRSSALTDTSGRNAVLAELARVRMKRERAAEFKSVFAGRMPSAHEQWLAPVADALKQTGRTWTDARGLARRLFRATRLEWLRIDQVHKLALALKVGAQR